MAHQHMLEDFQKRFVIATILTIPILIFSPLIQSLLGYSLSFPGDQFFLLGLATLVFTYGGKPFLHGLVAELKHRQPGMMTLIGIAISIAYAYSAAVVLGFPGKLFFWELATLIDVMLLGHIVEMRSIRGASRALEKLAALMPASAHVILPDGSIADVPISDLKVGSKMLVRPGEKIAADGTVQEGPSEVNEAALTGESTPILKQKGDHVIGGSVNGMGSLTIEVTKTGKDSYLARVIELVRVAQESKSRAQDLANKVAYYLTLIALGVGGITFAFWFSFGMNFVFALERMVTVMVITCPHALGLAVPLVIAVIVGLGARQGLLIRNKESFEKARELDVVVFDKTGTLTKGAFGVTNIIPFDQWSPDEMLAKAAALEVKAEHSIARAIVAKAIEKKLQVPDAEEFHVKPGYGITGLVAGQKLFIGNVHMLDELQELLPENNGRIENAKQQMAILASQGKTVAFVATDKGIEGIIGLADLIREESKEACAHLFSRGIEVIMITGDNRETASSVAKELGIKRFFAEVLPGEKAEKIKGLQQEGYRVGMVGDGINDAPALTQADVGIAIGAGTDIAIESADVVLVHNDPRDVVAIIDLSKASRRKMLQNLWWATGYNIIAIPLAAGLFFPLGIILPPAFGALIMSLSTVIVALNSRFIAFKPRNV